MRLPHRRKRDSHQVRGKTGTADNAPGIDARRPEAPTAPTRRAPRPTQPRRSGERTKPREAAPPHPYNI